MKEGIHPRYEKASIVCACGNVIETRSTKKTHPRRDLLGVPSVLHRQAEARRHRGPGRALQPQVRQRKSGVGVGDLQAGASRQPTLATTGRDRRLRLRRPCSSARRRSSGATRSSSGWSPIPPSSPTAASSRALARERVELEETVVAYRERQRVDARASTSTASSLEDADADLRELARAELPALESAGRGARRRSCKHAPPAARPERRAQRRARDPRRHRRRRGEPLRRRAVPHVHALRRAAAAGASRC